MSLLDIITLSGDPIEMGEQLGAHNKDIIDEVRDEIARHNNLVQRSDIKKIHGAYILKVIEYLKKNDPATIQMCSGLEKGLGLDDSLLKYNIGHLLFNPLEALAKHTSTSLGCTAFAVYNAGLGMLGKTRDSLLELAKFQRFVRVQPKNGLNYICMTSVISPLVYCSGMNEHLIVADTSVCSSDIWAGLPAFSLMRHILENFETETQAVDYLKKSKRMGRNNIIILDKNGYKAVFESGKINFGVFSEPGNISLATTNHHESDDLKPHNIRDPEGALESRQRYKLVEGSLPKITTPEQAMKLMQTHDPPGYLCWHGGSNNHTIGATIYGFSQKVPFILHCDGYPCTGFFEEIPF
ncbi:MAG: hypothetical protein JRF49_12200 [Deltaproteobacteria bacterium]|nr:hypothetical protein [Deltaproteobacteria bacterium]